MDAWVLGRPVQDAGEDLSHSLHIPSRAMTDTATWAGRDLHFVGIGGAGMSGLALVAAKLGATVTGSDRAESDYLAPLRALGVAPAIGEHDAANVPAGAEVVYSTAVAPDNPERAAAGGRELHRADLLAELTRLKPTIAISGTHGKTTTTSMAVHVLRACGLRPSYLVGGALRATGLNADWDDGEWLVVEADESDRSLLKLGRQVAVVTNAELDHHATYGSRLDVDATFREFLAASDHPIVWNRPDLVALSPGRAGLRRGRRGVRARRHALQLARPRGPSLGAGHPQRGQRGRRARGHADRRRGRGRGGRRAGRVPRRGAALRPAGHDARPARWSTTTTPTIRPRSRRRSPPRARSGPGA